MSLISDKIQVGKYNIYYYKINDEYWFKTEDVAKYLQRTTKEKLCTLRNVILNYCINGIIHEQNIVCISAKSLCFMLLYGRSSFLNHYTIKSLFKSLEENNIVYDFTEEEVKVYRQMSIALSYRFNIKKDKGRQLLKEKAVSKTVKLIKEYDIACPFFEYVYFDGELDTLTTRSKKNSENIHENDDNIKVVDFKDKGIRFVPYGKKYYFSIEDIAEVLSIKKLTKNQVFSMIQYHAFQRIYVNNDLYISDICLNYCLNKLHIIDQQTAKELYKHLVNYELLKIDITQGTIDRIEKVKLAVTSIINRNKLDKEVLEKRLKDVYDIHEFQYLNYMREILKESNHVNDTMTLISKSSRRKKNVAVKNEEMPNIIGTLDEIINYLKSVPKGTTLNIKIE